MSGLDPLDRPLPITFFTDFAAREARQESYSMRALATRINAVTAPQKSKLPWLKCARFGDTRTDKLSLRHDGNVLAVSGIEADYDGEITSFDDAAALLEKAGIAALIYTSPSHTVEKPRWRVLCPLSCEMAPEERGHMLGRLNGLFAGAFSGESFTLSQAFYFGSIARNPSHRVEVVEGSYIDEHDDLDEVWRGRPHTSDRARTNGGGAPHSGPMDEASLLAEITSGHSYHASVVRLLGKWATVGVPYMEARARLLAAFDTVFPTDRDERWQHRRDDVDRCLSDIYGKQAQRDDEAPKGGPSAAPETEPPPGSGMDQGTDGGPLPGLQEYLAIEAWAGRPIPPTDRLLGDLLTTTSRMFLVGRTGLGKTLLGFAMACGVAIGCGFLHWPSGRPARVLYVDGEMPGELIKTRSVDALRRSGTAPLPGNLVIYSRDTEDEFAAKFPTLGRLPPLNTEAGMNFLLALIHALGGVDVVIFDNVMSLIAGDQKDEIPWSDTLPLIAALTAKRIGQVWLDHTGHNTDRQYGSSTKAWRFDVVGVMTPLPDDQREPHETAFILSFEYPGKARRRTPDNWRDFETCTIRLRDDRWTSETAGPPANQETRLSPMGTQFHQALLDALAISATPRQTTREAWFGECARLGLVAPLLPEDTHTQRETKRSKLRKYLAELKVAGWIGVDGEVVRSLRRDAP